MGARDRSRVSTHGTPLGHTVGPVEAKVGLHGLGASVKSLQSRFWEHHMRDEQDLVKHVEYIY